MRESRSWVGVRAVATGVAAVAIAGCGGQDGTGSSGRADAKRGVDSRYDGAYVLEVTRANIDRYDELEFGEHRLIIERGVYTGLTPRGPGMGGKVRVAGDVIRFGRDRRGCPGSARYRVRVRGRKARFVALQLDPCPPRRQLLGGEALARR